VVLADFVTTEDGSGMVHIMPPITIEQNDLDSGLEILTSTINQLSNNSKLVTNKKT
jgi:4-aminobutyrate aminotransferase-like enzyme